MVGPEGGMVGAEGGMVGAEGGMVGAEEGMVGAGGAGAHLPQLTHLAPYKQPNNNTIHLNTQTCKM